MRTMFVVLLALALLGVAACENTVKRPTNDNSAVGTDADTGGGNDTGGGTDTSETNDETTISDTDGSTPDEVPPSDSDEITTSDEEISDEYSEEEPSDDTTPIPDEETIPLDQCNADGGICVDDAVCPPAYTPINSPCTAGTCCIFTGSSGLRVDVIKPQPIPAHLLSIPAVVPQPGSSGTGTPPIMGDIAAPLLAIGLIETENGDGCDPFKTDATGFIVIVQRGNCTFSQKINNAAKAGAIALIIYNNAPGPMGMNADGVIPTVGIEQTAGQAILGFTKDHPDIAVAIRP